MSVSRFAPIFPENLPSNVVFNHREIVFVSYYFYSQYVQGKTTKLGPLGKELQDSNTLNFSYKSYSKITKLPIVIHWIGNCLKLRTNSK